jgi:hypothetical protein
MNSQKAEISTAEKPKRGRKPNAAKQSLTESEQSSTKKEADKQPEDDLQLPTGMLPPDPVDENTSTPEIVVEENTSTPEPSTPPPVVDKPKPKYNNYAHKTYTDFLMSSINLETFDKSFTYEMHYLCRGNPGTFTDEKYNSKKYYCRPVCAIFKRISREKIDQTPIDYETMKDLKYGSIIMYDCENRSIFRKEPVKPFWIVVKIEEKTSKNGRVFYSVIVNQIIGPAVEAKVAALEEKYKVVKETYTSNDDNDLSFL